MIKGSGLMPKPILAVFSLLLFIIAMIFLIWRLSVYLSNPCWASVVGGLEPLAVNNNKPTTLVFDKECLEKFVITSNMGECQMYCNRQSDNDLISKCTQKCTSGSEGEPRTFIIAIPELRDGFFGPGSKVIDSITKRNFKWLFDGKTEVFRLDCEVTNVTGIDECVENLQSWSCTNTIGTSSYRFTVDKSESGETCTISATLERFEAPESEFGGGGGFGGGGTGGRR